MVDSYATACIERKLVRKSRYVRKRHLGWERADRESGGRYTSYMELIAGLYPSLTEMELRICSLVKALKLSWEIAEIFSLTEHTIENHRNRIRMKMGLPHHVNLLAHLAAI